MGNMVDIEQKGGASAHERGFVLVTAIVFLAILMLLGGAAIYKSRVAITVSGASVESEQALAAANAGINYLAYYWANVSAGQTELDNIYLDIKNGVGTNSSLYVPTAKTSGKTTKAGLIPDNISELVASMTDGNSDGVVNLKDFAAYKTSNSWIRVYTFSSTGVSSSVSWGSGTDPQVAVWVTAYTLPTDKSYPYGSPAGASTGCSACSAVVYALGRAGSSYRLVRSYMGGINWTIEGFGAITSAPKFNDKGDLCTGAQSTTSHSTTNVSSSTKDNSFLIDVTQAPGGVAIASNNNVNFPSGNKGWDSGTVNSQVAGNNTVPWIVYDPGKVTAVAATYPQIGGANMNTVQSMAVSSELFGTTDYINYFSSATDQLFQLSVYREAANRIANLNGEQLTDINGTSYTVTTSAAMGNYTTLKTNNSNHARTGTLQWADFAYNVLNSIPMYGIVRVMVPTRDQNRTAVACPGGDPNIEQYKPSFTFNGNAGRSKVDSGKLIVYGMLFIDFFNDANSNEVYEPASPGNEVLLTPKEALQLKMEVTIPIMVNPVMAGLSPVTGSSDTSYTRIDSYPNGAQSNSEATDRLTGADGSMDLIWDLRNVGHNWSTMVHNGTSYQFSNYRAWMTNRPDGTTAWSSAEKDVLYSMLNYFYRTTKESLDGGPVNYAPGYTALSNIEAASTGFYINTKTDLVKNTASAADLYHVFVPSGYVHAWKRALQETGLAADWNDNLLPSGSPWHADRAKYFHVTRSGTNTFIDSDFVDLPAMLYAGGIVDMHNHVNVSGVMYTPGPLELEQKASTNRQYICGITVLGYGGFVEADNSDQAITVLAYDDVSMDKLPTTKSTVVLRRFYWQELQ